MTHVQIAGLERTYSGRPPVHALRGVDLDLPDGRLVAVLGPSGCGKTTLLRSLAGLERSDAGTITMGDRLLDGPGAYVVPEKRRIGLVPQEGALFPHLDVGANLAFGLKGRPKADQRRRVDELLDLIGLSGMAERRPHELSGGQQQRVAVARALAPEPDVVLLDEPFSALDAGLRGSLRDEVAATLRASGTTAMLVTHDQTEALTMADIVAVMREGRVVQVGAPADIYRQPVDLWVARFLGDLVELPGSTDQRVRACRPEQLRPAGDGDGDSYRATVLAVRFGGADALVTLTLDGGGEIAARWPSVDLPEPGDRLAVTVRGTVLDLDARTSTE